MNIGTIVEFFESMVKSSNQVNPNQGAYGGDLSGAAFNPIEFIKKPQVVLRIVSGVSFFFERNKLKKYLFNSINVI